MKILFVCWFCCAWTIAWAGEIKQWTDANGQTHFGDNPPEGVQAITLPIQSGKRSAGPAGLRKSEKKALKELHAKERHRSKAKAKARKAYYAQKTKRDKFCAESEGKLDRLLRTSGGKAREERAELQKKRRARNCS